MSGRYIKNGKTIKNKIYCIRIHSITILKYYIKNVNNNCAKKNTTVQYSTYEINFKLYVLLNDIN